MRIKVIENPDLSEEEIIIQCHHITPKIQALMEEIEERTIMAYHRGNKVVINLKDVLFFETEDDFVYVHTKNNSFKTDYRLYELEDLLPSSCVRISKSTICNVGQIQSLERKLTSSRAIQYIDSHKVSYVSRMFYPILKEKLTERSTL